MGSRGKSGVPRVTKTYKLKENWKFSFLFKSLQDIKVFELLINPHEDAFYKETLSLRTARLKMAEAHRGPCPLLSGRPDCKIT